MVYAALAVQEMVVALGSKDTTAPTAPVVHLTYIKTQTATSITAAAGFTIPA